MLVADATQKVPVCTGCRVALSKRLPTMPTFALANDLWIGRLPPPLRNLTLGAKLLLPIARGIVRRFHCKTDSGMWTPVDQRIQAFVGNFVAFPQADGGRQVLSLPPRETDLVESVQIVFAGSDPSSLQKARFDELGVSIDDFKRAYEYLRDTNEQYAAVRWDDEAAREFADAAGDGDGDGASLLGLPRCLAACVAVGGQGGDARQQGPADAVEPGAGSAPRERATGGVASAEGGAGAATDGGGRGVESLGGEDAAGAGGDDSEGDEGDADEGGTARVSNRASTAPPSRMLTWWRIWTGSGRLCT